MKVSELIAKLQTLPQDLEVVSGVYGCLPIVDAEVVGKDKENRLCDATDPDTLTLVVGFSEGQWYPFSRKVNR